jgi:hypothetical protein
MVNIDILNQSEGLARENCPEISKWVGKSDPHVEDMGG